MPKQRDTETDKLARVAHDTVVAIRDDLTSLRSEVVTKSDLKDMEDRLGTQLADIKAGVKQVIADEASNTVDIARLNERLTRVEKRLGIKA